MKFFFQKPVSAAVEAAEERVSIAPLKPARTLGGSRASPTTSFSPMDALIHLEFGQGGLEVQEVDRTTPGALYDELFKN